MADRAVILLALQLAGRAVAASPAALKLPMQPLLTGASIPALGFGTYTLDGDELKQALLHAIECGYRHIDTAAGYGNEAVVAEAIAESEVAREDFFITSKLWCTDHGADDTFGAILSSLAQLNTDYLDLFLVHAPNNLGDSAEEIVELRKQSWAVMTDLHNAGILRALGVSNFEPRHIDQLLEWGDVTPAVNQVELHAYFGQAAIRKYCREKDIVVQSFGSVGADGLLEDPAVQRIAAAHERSAAQISLRHSLQRGCAVLARSTTPERIKENARIFDFELSVDDMRTLDALESGERTYWDNSDVP